MYRTNYALEAAHTSGVLCTANWFFNPADRRPDFGRLVRWRERLAFPPPQRWKGGIAKALVRGDAWDVGA